MIYWAERRLQTHTGNTTTTTLCCSQTMSFFSFVTDPILIISDSSFNYRLISWDEFLWLVIFLIIIINLFHKSFQNQLQGRNLEDLFPFMLKIFVLLRKTDSRHCFLLLFMSFLMWYSSYRRRTKAFNFKQNILGFFCITGALKGPEIKLPQMS